MASRSDRQARKRSKRAAKEAQKASRRGDGLALLELEGPLADSEAALDLFVRDAEASLRQANDSRLLRLARACLRRSELVERITSAETEAVATCGWALVGGVLRASQWELAEALLDPFRRSLEARAPELLAWLKVYIEHRAAIPADELERLVPLSTASVAGSRSARVVPTTPEELESALPAATEPAALAALIEQLSALTPEHREPLTELAGRLAWRACLLHVEDPRRLRVALAALAEVGDPTSLLSGLRLARRRLDPRNKPPDLHALGLLLTRLYSIPAHADTVVSTLRAHAPPYDEDIRKSDVAVAKVAVDLGRRLLAIQRNPDVWVWTSDWHQLLADVEDIDEPPSWIVDVGRALVDDGSLARALRGRDRAGGAPLIDVASLLPWETGLSFVAQALDHVAEELVPNLSTLALSCLRAPETDQARKPGRVTVKQLVAQLRRNAVDGEFDPEVAFLISILEALPPDQIVPPEIAHAASWELDLSLGPTQLAFVDRHAKRLLAHDDGELLMDLIHEPRLSERRFQFVDAFLGSTADAVKSAWLLVNFDSRRAKEFIDHVMTRLLSDHGHDAPALLGVFGGLMRGGVARPICRRVAKAACAAIDAGSSVEHIPEAVVTLARAFAGGRKKAGNKKASKKKTGKKKASKKKTRKKKASTLESAEQAAGKKQAGKKKAGKKKAGKKKASTPDSTEQAAGKKKVRKKASKKKAGKKKAGKKKAGKAGPEQLTLYEVDDR